MLKYNKIKKYMDDSNNVITFDNQNKIKNYLEAYYNLIQNYYNINKLKINADKTNLLLIYEDKYKQIYLYE